MDKTEEINIRLIVEDEKSLYTSFSPDDEFNEAVKIYIKSKAIHYVYRQRINMTVMSREPIDEDRFRSAVSNWIKEEKATFKNRERETKIALIGGLIVGSILLILSLAIERQIEVLKYSLLPIMGSLALGKAAGILVTDVPTNRVERWLFDEIENNSALIFEYGCIDKAVQPEENYVKRKKA